MRIFKPAAIAAALLFILSCNRNADNAPAIQKLSEEIGMNPAGKTKEPAGNTADGNRSFFNADQYQQQETPQKEGDKQKQQLPTPQQTIKPDWDKKILKTASINLEVKDYNNYYASLREKVKSVGGYVAQEEQSQSDYKIENSMTIKVPVDQFDNAMTQFTANAEKINERKISSEDVTTEVIDIRSRIEAKKQVRQRYMDLMNQAKNMEEILNVQSHINGIQEEIESATGRMEYLSHSSVFSTIRLTYYQVLDASANNTEKTEPSFGGKVKDAFRTGWEIVSNLFILLITIWPLLLGSFVVYLFYKKMRAQQPKQV